MTGLIRREFRLLWRRRSGLTQPLIFFALVCLLGPLGVNPGPNLLAAMAPALLWLAILLASLLTLDRIFRDDVESGVMELLLLSPLPLWMTVLAKALAHYLAIGGVFVLAAPLAAVLLGAPPASMAVICISVALGALSLTMLGTVGAALTVGQHNAGALLAILLLPLYVPVLIFGAGAIQAAGQGLPTAGPLYLLAAMAVLHLTIAPPAAAAALRIAYD